jgi:transcription initiation factor TFIID subunit 9B
MDDIVLAVQARVGWEFGGRVPKEYTLSLAAQTNAASLPAVPEVFGVRLPSPADSLTAVDFDLIPNKPPPGVKLYDEEIEEVEESESEEDDDEDMEPAAIPAPAAMRNTTVISTSQDHVMDVSSAHDAPFPISAIQTLSDIDMIGTPVVVAGVRARIAVEEGSDAAEEEEGLFAGGDDEEEEESDAMEQVQMAPGGNGPGTNGVKRKLVEEEDYD